MKLLTVQLPPFSRHLIPFRSKLQTVTVKEKQAPEVLPIIYSLKSKVFDEFCVT
jgi:hypothetical protein